MTSFSLQVDANGGRSPERMLASALLARKEPGAQIANPGDLLDQAFSIHTGGLRALTAGGAPGDLEPASTASLLATLTGAPVSAATTSPTPTISPGSLEYIMLLNVDFLLQVVLEYVLLVESATKNAAGGSVDQLYESYLNTASTVRCISRILTQYCTRDHRIPVPATGSDQCLSYCYQY